MHRPFFSCILLGLFFQATQVVALDLHPLFSNYAVLQQEMPVPVWGKAKPGEKVTVRFSGQSVEAVADVGGRWMAVLAPLSMNAKGGTLLVETDGDSIEVSNVLVGEVWIGSGQSNMAMTVGRTFDAEATAVAADAGSFPGVRLFRVPVEGSDTRLASVNATWSLPTADAVERFSAVAFFFAARLAEDRSVPVGIIQSANGGTNAFSWINSETLQSDPVAETVRTYWSSTLRNHPAAMERYKVALSKWREKAAKAKKAGQTISGRAPREPLGPDHVKRPTGHYNAMIAPLQPYAFRGVIWYQGEANSRMPFYPGYKDLMLALVEDWRSDWATSGPEEQIKRRDFPFYLVQLPNFAGGDANGWPAIREQMLQFWQDGTNTGMVVAIDKGEADDIHPRDKKPVGERLAQFARAETYGENVVYSGPIFDSLRIEGDKALLTFQHTGSGLASLDGKSLRHFEIAGSDQRFFSADARIEGEQLVVQSSSVPEPRAVRYAWKTNPEGVNFGNADGFPASPFRTDSW